MCNMINKKTDKKHTKIECMMVITLLGQILARNNNLKTL